MGGIMMKIKEMLSGYGLIVVAGLVSVITLSAVTSLFINEIMKPKIVSLDIKQTTNDFVQQTAVLGARVNKEQLKAMTDKFNSSLKQSVDSYQRKGYMIIVSPAVVAGVPDITENIQKEISEKMKRGGS